MRARSSKDERPPSKRKDAGSTPVVRAKIGGRIFVKIFLNGEWWWVGGESNPSAPPLDFIAGGFTDR